MTYGYARCSTSETKQDVERQRKDLRAMGATEIYQEYESGTKLNRPELDKLMHHVADGDTVCATEVSRITRSVKQLCDIIEIAKVKHLKLILGTFIVDCTGSLDCMTEGMLKMMGVFAEIERNLIIERVRSGLTNARQKGIRLGRPMLQERDIPQRVKDNFNIYRAGVLSKTNYAKICGISRPTLNKYIAILTDR